MIGNKLFRMVFLGVLMFLCLTAFGWAEIRVTEGVTENKVIIDVDYSVLDGDDDKTKTLNISKRLKFENTGNAEENVLLSLTKESGYELSLWNENQTALEGAFTLRAAGAEGFSKIVILKALIPVDDDSGSNTMGRLKFGDKEYVIEAKVKSMLKINEVRSYVGGSSGNSISKDGDTLENILPGKKVELKFELENLFDKEYSGGDIDNIALTVSFVDEDDEDDFNGEIDEEAEEVDMNADEELSGEEAPVISFEVPADAKEKTYKLAVKVEGKDDNGAKHKVEWTIGIEIDRKKDDVRLEKAYLTTETLKCGIKETQLKVEVTNFGSNDQEKAALKIYSGDQNKLSLDYNFEDIYLDKDPENDDNSYAKTITIDGSSLKAGEYSIFVRVYIDGDEEADGTTLKLKVEDCPTKTGASKSEVKKEGEKEEEEKKEVIVVPAVPAAVNGGQQIPPPAATGGLTGGEIVETMEIPFTQIKGIVIFMSVVTGLLVVLIVLVFYSLVRKQH